MSQRLGVQIPTEVENFYFLEVSLANWYLAKNQLAKNVKEYLIQLWSSKCFIWKIVKNKMYVWLTLMELCTRQEYEYLWKESAVNIELNLSMIE